MVALDDLSTGSTANLAAFAANPRFRFESADIVTWSGVDAAVVGMFHVLQRPVEVMRVNLPRDAITAAGFKYWRV